MSSRALEAGHRPGRTSFALATTATAGRAGKPPKKRQWRSSGGHGGRNGAPSAPRSFHLDVIASGCPLFRRLTARIGTLNLFRTEHVFENESKAKGNLLYACSGGQEAGALAPQVGWFA